MCNSNRDKEGSVGVQEMVLLQLAFGTMTERSQTSHGLTGYSVTLKMSQYPGQGIISIELREYQ